MMPDGQGCDDQVLKAGQSRFRTNAKEVTSPLRKLNRRLDLAALAFDSAGGVGPPPVTHCGDDLRSGDPPIPEPVVERVHSWIDPPAISQP